MAGASASQHQQLAHLAALVALPLGRPTPMWGRRSLPRAAAASTRLLLALALVLCGGQWGPLGPSQHTCATAQELPWFTADVTLYSVSGVFYSVQHCPVLLNEVLLSDAHRWVAEGGRGRVWGGCGLCMRGRAG